MSNTITKGDIDRQVAFEVGLPVATVRKVTSSFLWIIAEHLSTFGHVWLARFGQFFVSRTAGMNYTRLSDKKKVHGERIQVYFKKGTGLRRTLESKQEN